MSTDIIEKLLRTPPPVRTPPGLLHDLQADITLPRGASRIANYESVSSSGWFRRWLPALGFAIWFLGCVVVLGIQSSQIAELRQQQRALKLARDAAAQQALAAEVSRAAATAELAQLKKDLADLQRLRTEISQLRADIEQLASLRAQNQQLRDGLKSQIAPPPKPEEDFFAVAQARAVKIKCMSNIKRIGLAARMWANESKSDVLPDHATLKVYASTLRGWADIEFGEMILVCPGDGRTSYEIVSPGAEEKFPNTVYSRCPIHDIYGLVDGSVQQVDATRTQLVQKDGRWVLRRIGE